MNEQRAGRRWKPLSLDLPPARMRYAAELRRHADASGQTLRDLSYRVGVSTATLSRAFNGDRILDDASLAALIQVFRLDTVQSQLLTFLADQARSGADTPVTAGAESATEGLADHLATLRQETGLTIREIAERLAATGTPVGKSSVERLLRDPGRSSVQALQVAGALISALPEERRGPALEGVFRAALHDAPGSTPPGTARLTVQMGGGKTAAMLQALRSDQAVPSEVTVAALARKLDLPVDELLALRRAATEPGSRRVPGRPVGEWSPFELEVHPAVVPARAEGTVLADLPAYVEREHDRLLSEAVQSAVQGDSRMVVLVGGSSTGKTRACWEAVQRLPEGWRLWHPYNPSRSEAVLEGIGRVEPRTVLWLNDAQHYLFDPSRGERVAAALRRLLSEPARGPVLVLGTLWPEYYAQLTSVPSPGAADVHAQARDLLTGRAVVVPDSFDGETLRRASSFAQADPRVAEALAMSGEHGGVTQFLAGAPELLRRYNDSSAAARALLDAAMDACRLGVSSPLPLSFLISAAEGYLSDSEWDLLPDDYAERAFAELARPVPGGLAPLRRIRSRTPGRPDRSLGSATALAPTTGPVFQLADYLQQYGQATRQLLCPPASFWHAATTQLTGSADLYNLANAAYDRYRIQWAHRLLRRAAEVADGQDLSRLARALETAGDRESAERLAIQAANAGDTFALTELARLRETTGDRESAERLAIQAANAGDTFALTELARLRETTGDRESAERLAIQAANAGDTFALTELARLRETTGDRESAVDLYGKAAIFGKDERALIRLAQIQQADGDLQNAGAFYLQGAALDHYLALILLAQVQEDEGDLDTAEVIARRATGSSPLAAARAREVAGDRVGAEALYREAADAGDTYALVRLAQMRIEQGDREGSEALYREAAEAGDAYALIRLARMRREEANHVDADFWVLMAANAGMAWAVDVAGRWPYGLDPDGTPTPPWDLASV